MGGDSYGGVILFVLFWFLFFFFLSGAYSTILGLIYILPSSINIKKNNIRKKSEKKKWILFRDIMKLNLNVSLIK